MNKEQIPGSTPILSGDGKTLTYGIFPQSYVSDKKLIKELNEYAKSPSAEYLELYGYYKYKDEYYARQRALPAAPGCAFDDGKAIKDEAEYWFKCEPIVWRILSVTDGVYFAVSEKILYPTVFDRNCPERFTDSSLQHFLNSTNFYDPAFFLDGGASIILANDGKVTLLSQEELEDPQYFASDEDRRCKTTDYARAFGVLSWPETGYTGPYWARTILPEDSSYAYYVMDNGTVFYDRVYRDDHGVRPAIRVVIK